MALGCSSAPPPAVFPNGTGLSPGSSPFSARRRSRALCCRSPTPWRKRPFVRQRIVIEPDGDISALSGQHAIDRVELLITYARDANSQRLGELARARGRHVDAFERARAHPEVRHVLSALDAPVEDVDVGAHLDQRRQQSPVEVTSAGSPVLSQRSLSMSIQTPALWRGSRYPLNTLGPLIAMTPTSSTSAIR